MKSPSPFELIRSELESAEVIASERDRSDEAKARLKLEQDSEHQPLSLEALYFENAETSKTEIVEQSVLRARGRHIYRLMKPEDARKNELIARVLAEVAKPTAA